MNENGEACEHLAPSRSHSSSDNEPDEIYAKKKHRKYLNRRGYEGQARTGKNRGDCQFPLLYSFITVIVLWIFGLSWITAGMRVDQENLSNVTRKICSEHIVMTNSIKMCTSLSANISRNQTLIDSRILKVLNSLSNTSSALNELQLKEHVIEKKVNINPELVTLPDTLHNLMSSIAGIGCQMSDFNVSLSKVVGELGSLRAHIDVFSRKGNNASVGGDPSKGEIPAEHDRLGQIKSKLSAINNTLWNHVKMMSEEESKLQAAVVKLKSQFEHYIKPAEVPVESTSHFELKNGTKPLQHHGRPTTIATVTKRMNTSKTNNTH